MQFYTPTSWAAALALKAEHPDAVAIAGGTDVMVELNLHRLRPPALLDLTRIPALTQWSTVADQPAQPGRVRIGAGVSYTRIIDELGAALPALAMAARTIGSPQIRNRGTLGGNLGSASPAGDAHPPLLAAEAVVEIDSVRGSRSVPVAEFFTGPKRSVLAPDELIAAVTVPMADGPQQFSKVGTRNAMVIAISSFALALHPARRQVSTGFGSAAPTPRRARAAEQFAATALPWDAPTPLDQPVARRFGELVAAAAEPIDDVRGSAAYRRHTLAVLARRTLTWAWSELCR
jgi:CO/xanthine dehydrogenase FAD-binding subunit